MHLGGVTASPASGRAVQQDRNLALSPGQRPGQIRFLIHGRGPDFTASSGAVCQAAGARVLVSALRAPRTNAICERLVGTVRREVPGRTLILGGAQLRAVLTEYQRTTTRPGRTRACPRRDRDTPRATVADPGPARIRRRPVLGGLINEYTHAA
jgi:putative transposase